MYKYHKNGDDDEASTSEICLTIIDDIGRTHDERLIMNRAIETCPSSSFLSILDHGKKQLAESKECTRQGQDDDIMSQKYHFLRLLHEYQQRCNDEGKYLLAKEFMEHEQRLRKEEEARQVAMIKKQHVRDRTKLVEAHDKQFVQFQECELVLVSLSLSAYHYVLTHSHFTMPSSS